MTRPEPTRLRVRRTPNLWAFLGTGVILGLIAGAVLDRVGPTDPSVTGGSSLAVLMVVGGLIGALVAAVMVAVLSPPASRSRH